MTSPQTPATTSAPVTGPITTITNAGLSLIQLGTTVISVPLKSVGAIGVSVIRLGTSVLTVPLGVVAPQTRSEVVSATNEVVDAAEKLYLSIINSVINGVDSVSRGVANAANEITAPAKK